MVRIDSREPLAVLVKYRHLPVFVLSAPVFAECGAFVSCLRLGHVENISIEMSAHKYQANYYILRNFFMFY